MKLIVKCKEINKEKIKLKNLLLRNFYQEKSESLIFNEKDIIFQQPSNWTLAVVVCVVWCRFYSTIIDNHDNGRDNIKDMVKYNVNKNTKNFINIIILMMY